MPLSLMRDASEGKGYSSAVGLQGVWQGGYMDENEAVYCPVCPVESPPDPPFKQAFSALYSKSSNCIIFQAPCLCLTVRLAPLIKLMEK